MANKVWTTLPKYMHRVYIVITGLLSFLLMVKLQPIQLTSTLNGQLAHHGDSVIFTCTTKGSQLLAWSSIEYINGDLNRKRIVFSSDQMTGTLSIPNDYTSAQLTNVHDDVNGRPVIESQLNITIQKTTQNSSISCHHVGSGLNETISFKLSDDPVLICSGESTCPGGLQCACETRDSNILAWESDLYIGCGNRLEFLSAESVGKVKYCNSETNPEVYANLTVNHVQNGVQVLTSELTIPDVMYHPDTIIVTCVNVGLGTKDSYGLTFNYNCNTSPPDGNPPKTTNKMDITSTVNSGASSIESGTLLLKHSLWILVMLYYYIIQQGPLACY